MLKRIFVYTHKYNFQIFFVFIFAIITSISTLLTPRIVGKAIDNIIDADNVNFNAICTYIPILLLVYITISLSNLFLTSLSSSISNEIIKDMRLDAFKKIMRMPISYFDNADFGDLMSRFTNDIEAISQGLLQLITNAFTSLITLIGAMFLMFSIDLKIGFVVIIVAPLTVLIARFVSKNSAEHFLKTQNLIGAYNSNIEESFRNLKVVKTFSYENEIAQSAQNINDELYIYGQKSQFYSSLANPSSRFVNNLAYVFIGLVGGLSTLNNGLSVGTIASLLTYSSQFTKPLNEITGILTQLEQAIASAKRFFELMDIDEPEPEQNKVELQVKEGNVDFRNISFSYDKNKKIIENFSIKIKSGSTVAIVGTTGAGKTTLVNLLMRFYELDDGSIYLDGINSKDATLDSVRLSYAMVLQDTWLFAGTIKDNIAFGKKSATFEEVKAAAKSAYAHNFIKRLPNGYNTFINDDILSSGEKQLLTIARAMLVDSPMLILDEATSSVDPRTELEIQKALKKLIQGKTSFIIAHRLSTIKDADLILVMDSGRIIESGNHSELINKKSFYYKLYNSQFEKNE